MADVYLGSESVRQYMIRTILNRYPHLELGEDIWKVPACLHMHATI